MRIHPSEVPSHFTVVEWHPGLYPGDMAILDDRFEWDWLPVIGPSSFVMIRRLVRCELSDDPALPTSEVRLADLCGPLGLAETAARRTVARLASFNLIQLRGTWVGVRQHMPAPRPARKGEAAA